MENVSERLYYVDQYIKEFNCNVVEMTKKDDKYEVVLDKTAFFPGGGGQSCDLGTVDNTNVIDVYEKDDKIIHVLDKEPTNLSNIKGKIDYNRRLDGMQQHLGQHVLSGCFYSLFGANTAGIHLGETISTIDIIGNITEDMIRKAEKRANEVIIENHKVNFKITNRKEAKKMGLRRELATSDQTIRVVEIEGLDINACCGVHPSCTIELQMIKLKGYEKHKGNTRIQFLAGQRAVNDYLKRDLLFENLCNELSAGEEEVFKSVNNLQENIKNLRDDNNRVKAELSKYLIDSLLSSAIMKGNTKIINKIFEKEDTKYLSKLTNSLTEEDNVVVLFASVNNNKVNLIFGCSKNLDNLNMGSILKDTISLLDGNGGGSKFIAQGGGKNNGNLENAIKYAINLIG